MRIRCNTCDGAIEICTEDGIECESCGKEYSTTTYMCLHDMLEDQDMCEYCKFFLSQCRCSFCSICGTFIDCDPNSDTECIQCIQDIYD